MSLCDEVVLNTLVSMLECHGCFVWIIPCKFLFLFRINLYYHLTVQGLRVGPEQIMAHNEIGKWQPEMIYLDKY